MFMFAYVNMNFYFFSCLSWTSCVLVFRFCIIVFESHNLVFFFVWKLDLNLLFSLCSYGSLCPWQKMYILIYINILKFNILKFWKLEVYLHFGDFDLIINTFKMNYSAHVLIIQEMWKNSLYKCETLSCMCFNIY